MNIEIAPVNTSEQRLDNLSKIILNSLEHAAVFFNEETTVRVPAYKTKNTP
jgi:hypothetical protein